MSKRPGGTAKRDADGRLVDSSYTAKIERQLAQMRITPMNVLLARKGHTPPNPTVEYEIIDLKHIPDFKCELCGHFPIVNVFTIQHKQTLQKRCIGSECAGNWADADLARAMIREIQRQKASIRNEFKYMELFSWYKTFSELFGKDEDVEKSVYRLKTGHSVGNAESKRLLDCVAMLPIDILRTLRERADKFALWGEEAQRNGASLPSGWPFALALVKRGRGMVKDYQLALEIMQRIEDA